MKKVITYGTFDLFHIGHQKILERAKAHGDFLVVGVTGDHYDLDRGKLNVEESLEERIENVRKTGLADRIIVENYEGQKISDIQKYDIDVFVIGSDWLGKFDYLNDYCQVQYLERTKGISSSQIREENKIIKIGMVGAGRIANRFVPESKFVSGVHISGICSLEGAKEFADKHEIGFYTEDYNKLIERVDAVYIATPHGSHYSLAKQALQAGKHVLCEKPMTLKSSETIELFEIASQNKLILIEAIKTAFSPGFVRLIEVAKSGIIGSIKDVSATFTKIEKGNKRELNPDSDGGSLYELGTYPLIGILKLLGEPDDVNFFSYMNNGIDAYTKVILSYKQAIATAQTGLGVKSEGNMVIAGTEGYIYVPAPWWKTEEFEVRFEDMSKNKKFFYKFYGDGLRYEIAEFVKQIKFPDQPSWKLTSEDSILLSKILEKFKAN